MEDVPATEAEARGDPASAPTSAPESRPRPALILTVDDDPDVSRAIARDLRRRYGGEQHKIVRAESGEAALDALRQMKLRGDLVAIILADYRMPQLNGIEFLERAMDIYSWCAPRALLTALCRHRGAAIDAINVVDLDYYLLKPWDPPEEKLFPVVDSLLEAWLSSRSPARARDEADRGTSVVGTFLLTCASSWPVTRCPTAGMPPTSRRAVASCKRRTRTGRRCPSSSRPTARYWWSRPSRTWRTTWAS